MKQSIQSQATFSFRFEGDSTIDTMLLIDTLKNFNELVSIASKEISPNYSVHLNVSAFTPGSFLIGFETVLHGFHSLIVPLFADASYVVIFIHGVMELKRLFGAKRPRKIQQASEGMAEITDDKGQKYIYPKQCTLLFKNTALDNCVINIAENAIVQGSGCTVETPNHTTYFGADDLATMRQPFPEIDTVQTSSRKIIVEIVRPVLQGTADWGLRVDGQSIRASIEDEDFLDRVHKKLINFMANDSLEVELRTTFHLDSIGAPIPGSERYFVDRVYGDVLRDSGQISMFDTHL